MVGPLRNVQRGAPSPQPSEQNRPHDRRKHRPPVSLRDRLADGGFAVTAEVSPPRGASTSTTTETAASLKGWVDAVNVTDNQGSHVRLASWAGSLALLNADVEPVIQMTCRDRN